jgi:L-seryl-tRNA(Ser) seleniumtransferase
MAHDLFRALPSVSRLLAHPKTEPLLIRFNREYVVQGCRDILDELRRALNDGHIDAAALEEDAILAKLEARLSGSAEATLQRVVNATGTVLHTNLGRAILPQTAIDAVIQAASYPVNLEYDLAQGDRGQRELAVESLLMDLSGAEAATAVNNNAAAVLLALNTLAFGKEVIVSRGELIEIGGAFRIPDIMASSGAILKEVGTTNRTHVSDYENALTDRTALLLKVHTSNYRVVGFVAEVGLAELVAIGRRRGIPVMEDLGSGTLVDLGRYNLPREPVVAERIALGADLITFSGDKILGGPQAGVAVGRATLVKQMAANPLHRAVRCGKLTIAALEATLRLYRESACIAHAVPTLRMFTRPLADIENVAQRALPALASALGAGFRVSVQDSTSQIGSGALPTEEIPTKVMAIEHDFMGPHRIAGRFRQARPPIIGRVSDDKFLLDARMIFDPLDLVPNWTDELEGPLPLRP